MKTQLPPLLKIELGVNLVGCPPPLWVIVQMGT